MLPLGCVVRMSKSVWEASRTKDSVYIFGYCSIFGSFRPRIWSSHGAITAEGKYKDSTEGLGGVDIDVSLANPESFRGGKQYVHEAVHGRYHTGALCWQCHPQT